MKHTIEIITPDAAKAMLEANVKNRRVVKTYVSQLASAMRAGEFDCNGETIKFSDSGVLLDGQHRLMACVKAGVSFTALVVRGLKDDSFYTIDTGRKRSTADALSREGYQNAHALAAALRWIVAIQNRRPGTKADDMSPAKALDEVLNHDGLLESVSRYGHSKIIPPAMAVALHYIFSRKDKDGADRFIDDMTVGTGLMAGDPVLVLRNKLLDIKLSTAKVRGRISQGEICAMVIRAWNARRSGRKMSLIKGLVTSDNGDLLLPIIE